MTALFAIALSLLGKAKAWPWKLIGKVALIVATIAVLWWIGKQIYDAGYKQADDHWKTQFEAMQRRAVRAEQARDIAIAQITTRHQLRQAQIALEGTRGHNEIQAATPANETPIDSALVGAWRASIDRLCVFPGPSGSLPDSCRPGASG